MKILFGFAYAPSIFCTRRNFIFQFSFYMVCFLLRDHHVSNHGRENSQVGIQAGTFVAL